MPTGDKQFGLTEADIICHSEGYKKGIASNHGDVMHWFPRHGKSMDTFRADVKALLSTEDKKTEVSDEYLAKLTDGYYRVRKAWSDKKSQLGAYRVLAYAKAKADNNPGYYVYDPDGKAIYPSEEYRIHTVVKGDSLWNITKKYLGNGSRYPEIKELNGLTSNTIYSGWKLKIPN